jgi:type IV secretion system protein VirB1
MLPIMVSSAVTRKPLSRLTALARIAPLALCLALTSVTPAAAPATTVNVTLAWLSLHCAAIVTVKEPNGTMDNVLSVAPNTTLALMGVESGGHPWEIGDNDSDPHQSYNFDTKEEAVAKANELLALGHNLDLGLMQVNSSHMQTYGVSTSDVFEPCRNVNIGTEIMYSAYHTALKDYPPGSSALFHAFIAYNCGNVGPKCQRLSTGYAQHVWSEGNAIAAGIR